jgi:hypothetical protein
MTRTVPQVGVYQLENFKLPPSEKEELLCIIDKPAYDSEEFISEIESAIDRSIGRRSLKVSRVNAIKALLKAAHTVEEALAAVRDIPFAVQKYYQLQGVRHYEAERQLAEILTTAERAANLAEKEFAGRGNTAKCDHAFLAADIAIALRKIGIEPKAYHFRETETPNVYWEITQMCIPLAGLTNIVDLYPYLRKGLKLSKFISE